MGKQQSGFTLIELIAVIVILGILAATAVPRFVNLQDEAQAAAILGVAGGLESSSALNHALDIANEAGLSSDPFITIDACEEAADLLTNGLPTGYSITTGTAVGNKAAVTCQLVGPGGNTNFVVVGACTSPSQIGSNAACAVEDP